MEGRIVCSENASVYTGVLFVLFLDCSDVSVLYDLYCQCVDSISRELADVKTSSGESSFNASKVRAVEIYFRFPVDSVKFKEHPFPVSLPDVEFFSVPEIRVEI